MGIGIKAIETVAHKIDNAVWGWIENLLCDRESLAKGLQAMLDRKSKEISPLKKRLSNIDQLIEDENKKIKRLVVEMGNHDNETVLTAFRTEIKQASKNLCALKEEYENINSELENVGITPDQQEQIIQYAIKIKERIGDANYNQKRQIMDILDVKAVLHYDDKGKWLSTRLF